MCDVVESAETSLDHFFEFIYLSSHFHLLICFLNCLLLGALSCSVYLKAALAPVTVDNVSANKSTRRRL